MEQLEQIIQWMSFQSVPFHFPPIWPGLSHSHSNQALSMFVTQLFFIFCKNPVISTALLHYLLPPHYYLTTLSWTIIKKSFLSLLIIPFKHRKLSYSLSGKNICLGKNLSSATRQMSSKTLTTTRNQVLTKVQATLHSKPWQYFSVYLRQGIS